MSRLICFPHAGGAATSFSAFAAALPQSIEIAAAQYPGRQDRRNEPFIETVADLAQSISDVLEWRDDVPTALFGHSMGATVAFEVARRLELKGRKLALIFASGRRAPDVSTAIPLRLESDSDVLAELRKLGGTDSALLDDDDVVRMILPAIRNDYRAAESYRYRPGPTLSCPLVVIHGSNDPRVSASDADRWRHHTSGAYARHVLDCGHFYSNREYGVVANLVAEYLRTPS